MPTIEQLAVTTSEGIGKADYSNEISLGRVRPGISLKYGETLEVAGIVFSDIASVYPWITTPLAIGGTANLVNWSTGVAFPYVTSVGYTYSLLQITHSMTQDFRFLTYMDTIFTGFLGTSGSGTINYLTQIVGMGTNLFDPTGATAHLFDVIIENLGGATMQGSVTLFAISTAVGTPPLPVTKIVVCKFCGHETEVPVGTNSNRCSECGETTLYVDLSHIREL